jgi:hypothetical protein
MTAAFGGSGLNLITLTGDGPVILQSTLHKEFEDQEEQEASGTSAVRQGLLGRI